MSFAIAYSPWWMEATEAHYKKHREMMKRKIEKKVIYY